MPGVSQRNEFIRQDYEDGKSVATIAQSNGISSRQVRRVLKDFGISGSHRREYDKYTQAHRRIGNMIYNRRVDELGLSTLESAQKLGYSMNKLQALENGINDIELLDLPDIARVTGNNCQAVNRPCLPRLTRLWRSIGRTSRNIALLAIQK